jgi:hypothetical protein
MQAFRLVLLGSCNVVARGPAKTYVYEDGCKGAFGLLVHSVPNTGMFWRVGAFSPWRFGGKHGDSLPLFKALGKVETIEII